MPNNKPILPLAWALCIALAPALPAQAQSIYDSLQACRMKDDPQMRLACYDEIRLAPPGAQRPVPPLSVAPPPIPVTPPPGNATGNFGFENKTAQQTQIQSIDSTIEGHFSGWGPKSRFRLANGQVWQVVDDSSAFLNLDNPKVQIRRGMMGAFYIEFERSNRSARVRRVE
ncbi:MAG: hypothetical protein U1F53_01620 [Burkholderiaceae bacterium]